ncbi:MAG: lactonase family protein [Thermoguttaceae bacterium]|nr:lactonase family protein [Thermoguttaceae bacterium]MDW8078236.1 lactonase family protein [Thermoguttaceae bacterium]
MRRNWTDFLLLVMGLSFWPAELRAEKYWMYIGTYTGGQSRGIYKVDVDTGTPKLGDVELVAEVRNPSFLALHPTGRFLYAVGELQEFAGKRVGAVSAFAIEAGTGRLRLLNQQSSGGAGPCHLLVDATGRWVLVANYSGGTTAVLPISQDGSVGAPVSVKTHQGRSVHPTRQREPHPHQVWIADGTNLVLVPDLGTDQVVLYRLDGQTGQLAAADPPAVSVPPGSGPRHLAYAPGNQFLFVLNELTATVSVFRCKDAVPVELVETVSALPADFKGENTAAEIVVHPSGRWVFTSNRGHDSIAIFAFDQARGQLRLQGHAPSGGRTPRNFAVDPSGRWLFSANQNSDLIVVYRIDNERGRLESTGLSLQVGAPVCIVFQPMF